MIVGSPNLPYSERDKMQSEGILELFEDKQTAVMLIRQLREIEKLDKDFFQSLHLYCQGIIDLLRWQAKKRANRT